MRLYSKDNLPDSFWRDPSLYLFMLAVLAGAGLFCLVSYLNGGGVDSFRYAAPPAAALFAIRYMDYRRARREKAEADG